MYDDTGSLEVDIDSMGMPYAYRKALSDALAKGLIEKEPAVLVRPVIASKQRSKRPFLIHFSEIKPQETTPQNKVETDKPGFFIYEF